MRLAYRALGVGNKLLNTVEKRLQRPKLISRPVAVDVVLTKACNFACTFCKDYETPSGAKRISVDNFEQLARQVFPTASRLNICSGGEPYLHNGLTDLLQIAKRYGLYTWVLSNGSLMKPDIVARLVSEQLISEHGFSVDGCRAETVEAIRINADLPMILANIRMLLQIREEQRLRKPRITIRYALMRSNIEELVAAVHQWGDMGIDRIDCSYLSLANGMDPGLSLYHHQTLLAKCLDQARTVAQRYPALKLNLPPLIADEQQRSNSENCTSPWDFVMIDTNGEVMPCYRAFEALRFPSVYGPAGISFRDLWNSDRYQSLRRTTNNDAAEKFYPYCSECENRCGWGGESVHLGDSTWVQALGTQWVDLNVNHQRPAKGGLRKPTPPAAAKLSGSFSEDQ